MTDTIFLLASDFCEEYQSINNENDATWELVSVRENFNPRDWIQPSSYVEDVVDLDEARRVFGI